MLPLLIVGLRNPGEKYRYTRHNIGALLVEKLSQLYSTTWNSAFQGDLGSTTIEGRKVYFLLPSTYMNLSGFSVQTAVDYYKLPLQNLLILCDDVDIPFGEIRIRAEGGTGGHNGLKHIEQQLASPFYSRLRLGVGKDPSRDLADYVLERFSSRETDEMQPFLDRGIEVVKMWIAQGVPVASQKAGQLNHDYKLKGVNPNENNRSSSL